MPGQFSDVTNVPARHLKILIPRRLPAEHHVEDFLDR